MNKIRKLTELFAKYKRDFSSKTYYSFSGKIFMFREEKEKSFPEYIFIKINE